MAAVRMRPAMYIGDTSVRGLHHCVYEVVDNSIDEALAGYCTSIEVVLNADGSVSVNDNGRGIPVDMHATEKKPAVEVVLTTLHAGGKFDHRSYKVSGGLHGVGVSCVNALSEWLEVEVRRDGIVYHQGFEKGVTASPLEKIGKTKGTGTKVTFLPDASIFSTMKFEWDILANRLRELAFLNKGIEIRLAQEEPQREEIFKFKGGIAEFVEHLNRNKSPIHPKVICFESEKDSVMVEIAFQYTEAFNESLCCYVNNINTIEGGTHLSGFRSALTRSINNYAKANKIVKEDAETMSGDDVREGLTAVISVKMPNPQFEGQTKTKLGNSEVQGIVESVVNDELATFMEEHPSIARRIVEKGMLAARARDAARKARDLTRRKGALDSAS
ncbi:MAG: ATP-binding protein, partial [Kiritimatiellia bacterium]